jgi:hypothetical protein
MSAFENRLQSLREFPEKKLIFELTGFAEHHIDIAHQVVELIYQKLKNVSKFLYF